MFVATRELKVVDRQGNVTLFRPGDEVVGFEGWGEVPRRAHLNLEYVKEVSASKKGTPKKKPAKRKD